LYSFLLRDAVGGFVFGDAAGAILLQPVNRTLLIGVADGI